MLQQQLQSHCSYRYHMHSQAAPKQVHGLVLCPRPVHFAHIPITLPDPLQAMQCIACMRSGAGRVPVPRHRWHCALRLPVPLQLVHRVGKRRVLRQRRQLLGYGISSRVSAADAWRSWKRSSNGGAKGGIADQELIRLVSWCVVSGALLLFIETG